MNLSPYYRYNTGTHTKSVTFEHTLTDLARSSCKDFDFFFHVSVPLLTFDNTEKVNK